MDGEAPRLRGWNVWSEPLTVVVVVVAGAVAGVAAGFGTTAGLGVVAVGWLLVWILLPRRSESSPRRLVIVLGMFCFASVMPGVVFAALQLVALVGAYVEWLRQPAGERRGGAVVGWASAAIVFWAVLTVHPNIPDIDTGLLGFRKTVLALGGLVLGCAIPRQRLWSVERLVVKLLVAMMSISIVGHLWIPALVSSVKRDADVYTSLIGGQARLQGIFAGPFHAATAAVFLIGWASCRFRRDPALAILAGLLGASGLDLALVRTAYVALACAVLAAVFLTASGRQRARRAYLLGVAVLLGVSAVLAAGQRSVWGGRFFALLLDPTSDRRFFNRLPGYAEGLSLIQTSPVFGWGAGAAGDTLGDRFPDSGAHITAHNIMLKIVVEGGLIGLLLWIGVVAVWWKALDLRSGQSQVAVVSVIGLAAMGTTGSAIETLPVAYLILLVAGLGVSLRPMADDERSDGSALPAQPVAAAQRPVSTASRGPGDVG